MNAKVIAGIVSYNPDEKKLNENIEVLSLQCEKIFIVDNASDNLDFLESLAANKPYVELICNKENRGIAAALNQLIKAAEEEGYDWILTLDQDSTVMGNLVERYKSWEKQGGIGMISCNIIERKDQIREVDTQEYIDIDKCITSGCYTNIRAVLEVGGFNEWMFIDYVDFDMCIRMKEKGYKLVKLNYPGLLHSTGDLEPVRIGKRVLRIAGNRVHVYHESPIRVYYFFRNTVYFWRKYGYAGREYTNPLHILWRALLIAVYERPKWVKIKMIVKGIADGCKAVV